MTSGWIKRVGLATFLLLVVTLLVVITVPKDNTKPTTAPENTPPVSSYQPLPTKEQIFGKSGSATGGSTSSKENFSKILEPFTPLVDEIVPPQPTKNPVLTDKQLFPKLFPARYLSRLDKMQDVFVQYGWIQASSRVSLDSEKNVLGFLHNAVDVAIQKGFYTSAYQAKVANDAIAIYYPQLLEKKKNLLRRQALMGSIFAGLPEAPTTAGDFVLSDFFGRFVENAHAQINVPGIWETAPTCFKAINPEQGMKGGDLFAICCNCGCKIIGYSCVFVADCGPFAGQNANSSLCDLHFGCLNNICQGEIGNAIWDGEDAVTHGNSQPTTFICGCDEPEHPAP